MSGKSFLAVMAVLGIVALLGFGVVSKSGKQLEVGEAAPVAELPVLEFDEDSPRRPVRSSGSAAAGSY